MRDYSHRKETLASRSCVVCSRDFNVPRHQREVITTCCSYCQSVALSLKKMTGFYLQCSICDKPVWTMQGRKNSRRYCSKKCCGIGFSIFNDKNTNNIINTGRKKYYGANWLAQRRRARQRDGFRCVKCGISEDEYKKELSVHHIEPFVYFETYQKANELHNLMSVCEPCHRKIHSGTNSHFNFDKDKIVFKNELNTTPMKHREKAIATVSLLFNTDKTLKDVSIETGLSYTGVLRIYHGHRWSELYENPAHKVRPRKKAKN